MTRKRTPARQNQHSANSGDAFRVLFLRHPVPTWAYDATTLAFLEVNDAAVRLYGYSRDEFLSMTITDIRSPDKDGRPPGNVQGGLEGSNEASTERHRLKDGRVIDVQVMWRALAFRGRDAKLLSAQEMTERKLAEERLQRSEQRFRQALENIPDVVVIYDRDLRIQYINDATRRITGRPTSDFIGHREEEIWPPEVYRAYLPTLQEAFDTRQARSAETTILLPRGSRALRITCVPLLDEQGDIMEILGITHDDTERQRADEALRASEEKFKDVFESANVGKSITLPTGELSVNKALADLLGYTPAELATMTWQELTPPEDIEAIQAILTPLLTGDRDSARFTKRYVHKDGSFVWFDVSTVMRRGEDDKPRYFLTTVVDITERRLTEEKLRVSERLFSDAFRLGPAGMTITRIADGRFLDVNECFLKTFEFGRDEVIGHTSTELNVFTVEQRSELIQKQLRSGGLREHELQARSKSGRLMKLLFSSQPIELEGEPCHVTVFVDITELHEVREREREAVRGGNVGLWDWDLRSNRVYFSPEWKRQIGYADDEISDDFSEWQSRLHSEDLDRCLQTVQAFLASPGPRLELEFRFRHKDGSYRHIFSRSSLMLDEQGQPVRLLGSHVDVTERTELQTQFLRVQKMESVGRLAGGVAHDFNNLLTVINGVADLAMMKLREGDPLRADLEEIRRAGDRGALLTQQLLAFSRKQVLQSIVLSLNTVIADMQSMLRRLIGEDIGLALVPAENLGRVRADPGQIEQVLMNLAVNARDAMPRGGTLTIATRNVELDKAYAEQHPSVVPGSYVMLSISDTGVGMDRATQARIFEPFFTTKDPGKGTGLGLSTVYGIVKQSGGSIWVYSELGKGTSFNVYLPQVEGAADRKRPVRTATARGGTETILIVEDEEGLRHLAERALKSAGYQVLMAANGAEALLLLERFDGPVHLMLTDVVMPGMSGRDLAERLRETRPGMKVLYSSGYTDDAILHHAVLDDVTCFIGKPYSVADLMRKVREVLEQQG